MKSFTDFYEPPEEVDTDEIISKDIYDKNALDAFVDNFSSFTDNLKKAELFIEEFQKLSEQLSTYVTKEDLQKVVTGHLLFVNENIKHLKDSLGGLSKKDLDYIQETVKTLSLRVKDILTEINQEVTKNKKIIYDSVTTQQEKIDDINSKLSVVDVNFIQETIHNQSESIEKISEDVTTQLKKINNQIYQDSEKNQKQISDIVNKVDPIVEEVDLLKIQIENSSEVEKQNSKSINVITNEVKSIQKELPTHKQKLVGIESSISLVENKIKNIERNDLSESLKKKITGVEKIIKGFNKYFDNQNEKINLVENQLKDTLDQIKKQFVDDRFIVLNNKIKYLEEVLDKFNEKTILSEENILVAPPNTKTPDPLTPLNQNFVTFEQLQKHYQTFIFRVQQQLAAIGGGGAGWLYDLGDVDSYTITNAVDGDFIRYVSANSKWEAQTVSFASTSYVDTQISNLINSAPATLNTLKELADAINDDNNFATTIITQLPTQFSVNNITSATTVYTLDIQSYRGAEFLFTISNGSFHKIVKTLVIHDGTNFSFSDNFLDDNEAFIGTKNTDYNFAKHSGNNNVYLTISPTSGTANVKGKVNFIAL